MKREYLAMYFHEEDIREQSLEKGKQLGRIEGEINAKRENTLMILNKKGVVSKSVKTKIETEEDIDILNKWFEIAIEASTIEEFVENM